MVEIGFTLSSEEFGPRELVALAAMAEQAGFDFLGISDHFHPWVEMQGNSSFSWSVMGALSQVTSLPLLVGVVAPIMRYHPAIVAQAAATMAILCKDTFLLGLGTGENLNEHILGLGWPEVSVRQEMFVEALDIIRELWKGEYVSYYGTYYTVEKAKLYTLPPKNPPIIISAYGPKSARIAGELGDGLVSTKTDTSIMQAFKQAGGEKKPAYAQISVCYAADEAAAAETIYAYWPIAGVAGQLMSELRLPLYFEQAKRMISREEVAKKVPLGNDPEVFIQAIQTYVDIGFDSIYIHQIGPEQEAGITFFEKEVLPAF